MNNRLVIYFHYDPRGQADTACRFAVQAMRKQSRVLFFVHNGALTQDSRVWLMENEIPFLERENTGMDVGAYRDALLQIGRAALDGFEEVILMNYTLAGPVCSLQKMFDQMQARPELDFWGLSRHYAMRSRRFGRQGRVPEHIQSHFIAVRRPMYEDFWQYWQKISLPHTYEESIRFHETRFTEHFAGLGYHWDTVVDGEALRDVFVNPIMACPMELILRDGCPFFKRRSFFTPYGDELRRTDGRAAAQLYTYVKDNTAFPVDDLIRSLLPTQPLTRMSQNLHWHYRIPESAQRKPVVFLSTEEVEQGRTLQPETIYAVSLSWFREGPLHWYEGQATWDASAAAAAAALFEAHPTLGVLGPAMPLYPAYARAKWRRWQTDLPVVKKAMQQLHVQVPLEEEQPLPVPNGGCLLLRGAAFPQGLPPLKESKDFWLLPLLAQQNGFYSADAGTEGQILACADVYQVSLWPVQTPAGAGKLLARRIKHALLDSREADK